MFSSDKTVSAFYTRPAEESNSKSSYYVWFLGSRESKGLRGPEYIRPAVRQLLEKSSDNVKLTLQVSAKGLKIVQTPEKSKKKLLLESGPGGLASSSSGDAAIKQFVPHSSITCVYQSDPPHDDVVSCILLVSHSVSSNCPLYVHSFRCDSQETAEHLKAQLQALVDKPENQAKFEEIEQRLVEKGLLPGQRRAHSRSNASSKIGSDGRSLGRSSDSGSGGSDLSNPVPPQEKQIVTLHDSLAAELREKLQKTKVGKTAPLLLPPRDYDTMHRGRGNLHDIDERRALNPAIVGEVAKEAAKEAAKIAAAGKSAERGLLAGGGSSSSEQSSGIGSDERGNLTQSPQLLAERYSSGRSSSNRDNSFTLFPYLGSGRDKSDQTTTRILRYHISTIF